MNIIEVSKKENIGKVYEIFIDGENKGRWRLEDATKEEFDFYRDGELLTEVYFSSQLIRMEFEESIDWSKMPIDTLIWVRNDEEDEWFLRHFAKYENEEIFVWDDGKTSFTVTNKYESSPWEYAKLYQE